MKTKILTTSVLLLSLSACGGGSGDTSAPDSSPDSTPINQVPNSPASFTGDLTKAITTENNSTSGSVKIADNDSGEALFSAQTDVKTNYGNFTITEVGIWTYTLNKSNVAVASLIYAANSLTDNIPLTSADGTPITLAVNINGVSNSPASFSGDLNAKITINNGVISGKAIVTDLDAGEAIFNTVADAQYGAFTINENGHWQYEINKNHELFNSWNSVTDNATDTIILTSEDGSTVELTITINNSSEISTAKLIYLNEERLKLSKAAILADEPQYTTAYQELLTLANKELNKAVDPVTNKTLIPASGDIHDYHTIGSYYWPDPTKDDGLPWIYKDGELNRDSTGPETDWTRRKSMLNTLNILNLAFYFSNDLKYINKAKSIVKAWFIDDATKMNPNLNYGKAIPGKVDGTNFAVIDWTDIGKVISTIQLLEQNNLWDQSNKMVMDKWFDDYYLWLTTSNFGISESNTTNNHGTNYDYQLLGIMIYLDKKSEASAIVEAAKTKRVAAQIAADGSQPLELARTKSVNYTVNNLWALARITDLARRHTSVDLWSYASKDDVSLKAGYDFVVPYITEEKTWTWRQIIGGGAQSQLINLALPMFSRTELMLGVSILPNNLNGYNKFSAQELLTYAP